MAHHIILEEREQLSISGVEEVESFDENTILLITAQGALPFLPVLPPGPWAPGLGAAETPALGVGEAVCSSIRGLSLGGKVGRSISGLGVGIYSPGLSGMVAS